VIRVIEGRLEINIDMFRSYPYPAGLCLGRNLPTMKVSIWVDGLISREKR
jgi:hypothetical protein